MLYIRLIGGHHSTKQSFLKMAILLCFFLVLLFTLVSSNFLKKITNSKFNLPPSPSSLPVIGNLHHLAGLPHRCFHNLSKKYGPVMLLRLGSVPVVVISSSEAAEAVLKAHDLECCSRPKTLGTGKFSYGFKDIALSQYGEYWRKMRKLAVIELFSLKRVQSFRYIREEEVGLVVKKVSESALRQSPVDLSKTFFSLTASIICRVALGQNFNEDGFDLFLAGVDTSAVTMIWAMSELVRNPRALKKAQEKIRTTLGEKKEIITEDDLGKVDYLTLIIKETFRLHPALPFILPRETMSHVKIQGYDIPPKTQIQINVWTIGRDPKRWTDPKEFIPERFTDSSVDFRGQHFELLPFGSGRRMCPAMPMGVATVELGLMNLLYFFDWELPDGINFGDIDMEETGNISIVKKNTNSKFNLPPSPSSLPVIGNLHHLAGLPHRCFHNLSKKYGPVMLLRLGSVPVVVISSSEAAEAVLKAHDLECCSRPKTLGTGKFSYGFKDIALSQYGEYWRKMRKLAVIELFSLKRVQSFRYIREEEVGLVVKKVSESALRQSPVDLSKTFFSLTASIICRVALGQNFNEDGFG
ncbi:hypothetical protein HID58_015374 [Brassica napus]|uniref:Uncharacterized protein n=1 Tax=Brassica napus TaxID=3708 RepID=A0ABQ8DKP1_BRANA|nr:hypothetical protein HID58_015374 [Brassica napus]